MARVPERRIISKLTTLGPMTTSARKTTMTDSGARATTAAPTRAEFSPTFHTAANLTTAERDSK
jgi:hypothetical protein